MLLFKGPGLLFLFLFHLQVTATDAQFSYIILPLQFRQQLSTLICLQVFDFTIAS